VVAELVSFRVTSWHGHRNDADQPAAVRSVWRDKFRPGAGRPPERQSNVDLAVLDASGRVVYAFDAFPQGRALAPGRDRLARYTVQELRRAVELLQEDPPRTEQHPLQLPTLKEGQSGVRVMVRLMDERMRAYAAPVVEAVALEAADWAPLDWPARTRDVSPSDLLPWLSQVYPPGVMERTDPKTKFAYGVASVSGSLTLKPLSPKSGQRRALLAGKVQFTDEGPDEFRYSGDLEILLTYAPDSAKVVSLRGWFEGIYPRFDRMHREQRQIPLLAVFDELTPAPSPTQEN
jgi:hypothetical protein